MITDEERRKIAEKLRDQAEAWRCMMPDIRMSDRRLTDSIHMAFGLDDVDTTVHEALDALADLIGRGECKNVYDGSVQDSCDNGFLCSVCGCKVEDEEHYRVSGTWNYCPGCGRVVLDGTQN
ncbi:hypothetical protein COLAER_00281 [Collinsella aerofaciens ATCC 25986]|uniref:Uncharacterized protein n=1 Tax=Collinsella aerofaciens (strain ATCC 25986 / DSM 3979 / JCM 10188 / KCTC 3647 / NCTC 11838 / VPI 1003) TaxID=411903 RepID=A4E7A0_COLAA|nr:hypothetical protein [Collinsella aerofaciens]EBA40609.1 hypothetical protein COLAER_00281 [Collinsella aerofaciens ATCC 25986]QIA33035.1 hypothetical protein GXM19_01325 [Collinsella aerofaciens ATCC 25986]SUY68659.1 Uncharacterised protein [Collinsella aerofaciens]